MISEEFMTVAHIRLPAIHIFHSEGLRRCRGSFPEKRTLNCRCSPIASGSEGGNNFSDIYFEVWNITFQKHK